jgi:hypothetical protein
MNKSLILKAGLVVLLVLMFVNCAVATPTEQYNGHYYEVVETGKNYPTWEEAKIAAAEMTYESDGIQMQGHLATITSEGEDEFVSGLYTYTQDVYYWLGGYQPEGSAEPSGNWQWVTGETWSYTNWEIYSSNSKEPSETTTEEYGPENYLITWHDYTWNDWGNTKPASGYIVEYEPGYESIDANTLDFPSIILTIAALVGLSLIFRRKKN